MNRFLASSISALNSTIAALIILICLSVGAGAYGAGGAIIGIVVGVALAILSCGLLALIIDMRNAVRELVEISQSAK